MKRRGGGDYSCSEVVIRCLGGELRVIIVVVVARAMLRVVLGRRLRCCDSSRGSNSCAVHCSSRCAAVCRMRGKGRKKARENERWNLDGFFGY